MSKPLVRNTSVFALSRGRDEEENEEMVMDEQMMDLEAQVRKLIDEALLVHPDRLDFEVSWFFRSLGIHTSYFASTTPASIAKHVSALYAAKLMNTVTDSSLLSLNLTQETEDRALYVVPSQPLAATSPSEVIEDRIEREYLREGWLASKTELGKHNHYRFQVYRTSGSVSQSSDKKLRMFFVQKSKFAETEGDDLESVADERLLRNASDNTKRLLREVLCKAKDTLSPVMSVAPTDLPAEWHLVVAYRAHTTHSFYSGLTDLYHSHHLHSTRKFVETYKNGMRTYSIYLTGPETVNGRSIEERARSVAADLSLMYVLPHTPISNLFKERRLTLAEAAYAHAVSLFAHQFLSSIGDIEMQDLSKSLSGAMLGVLSKVRAGLKREALTEGRIHAAVLQHLHVVKRLFNHFVSLLSPDEAVRSTNKDNEDLLAFIRREAMTELDARVLSTFHVFNTHVRKTNFFKQAKQALSFRLDPSFLSKVDYPNTPFGIFFVVGAEFRGFHVRFVDVARGGIRVIRSSNDSAFSMNVSTLFDENYNLALTQQKKNKDIPEGGSKGTILLARQHQSKPKIAFQKYVDTLLDLLLPSDEVVDLLGKPELLFLGPDEGTADFMNWASAHACSRSYPYWKAFTTGKSRSTGGIPHDYYGMTTHSVHQYVLGIYRKLGIEEQSVRKFQTGGPDGDLGSNEIKISKDKTCAIVDGSGVLYDRNGIDREELHRLASSRLMIEHFDTNKLSSEGYRVLVNEVDITLPESVGGRKLEKGLLFRNSFHLEAEYLRGIDLFVPCGGRPAAVNVNNVQYLLDGNQPLFKYIVEGANLFFTQEARLQLEKWGCVVFKDASANKGGVTSSSLEVLAALALTDDEFNEHMCVTDDAAVPRFYKEYVEDVIAIIQAHARNEFECLWAEHERTGTQRCILTDQLSEKINALNDAIVSSKLYANENLKRKVFSAAIPKTLLSFIGLEKLVQRVPESYLKAIFGAHLACEFVYHRGLETGEFGFFEFMQEYST